MSQFYHKCAFYSFVDIVIRYLCTFLLLLIDNSSLWFFSFATSDIIFFLSKKSLCFKMIILGFVAIFELHYRHCRIWRRFLCNLWSPKLFLFIRSSPHFLELKLVLICNLWSLQLSLLVPISWCLFFMVIRGRCKKMRFLVSLERLAPTLHCGIFASATSWLSFTVLQTHKIRPGSPTHVVTFLNWTSTRNWFLPKSTSAK